MAHQLHRGRAVRRSKSGRTRSPCGYVAVGPWHGRPVHQRRSAARRRRGPDPMTHETHPLGDRDVACLKRVCRRVPFCVRDRRSRRIARRSLRTRRPHRARRTFGSLRTRLRARVIDAAAAEIDRRHEHHTADESGNQASVLLPDHVSPPFREAPRLRDTSQRTRARPSTLATKCRVTKR